MDKSSSESSGRGRPFATQNMPRQQRRVSPCTGILVGLCVICVLIVTLLLCAATPVSGAVVTSLTQVKLMAHRDGDTTRFYVENAELSEVTMTFVFSTSNLVSSVQFPHTATFKPGETPAFELSVMDTNCVWDYSYTNYYKLGSSVAVHDDSAVYLLPYMPGRTYRVSQGYNGKFSHKGSNQYAIDWQMPEGTPVCAARGGLVVKIKDDSDTGGDDIRFDEYNNYVLIRHDDGTLGHYCHLKKGGVKVVPGQRVSAGQMIALSGNTGFSSGAHLHFCVFKTRTGQERVSIPVRFKDSDGEAVTLVEGRRYKAPAVQSARVATAGSISAVR